MTEGTTYETVQFDGVMKSAYGSELKTPLTYEASYRKLLSFDAIPEDEQLSEKDILQVVNDARKANARQKAMQEALDAAKIEKPSLSDPQVQLKSMIKILTTAGRTPEQARQIAEQTLNVKLAA